MLFALLTACATHETPPNAELIPPVSTLQVHMTEQLVRVHNAREALLRGELETTRTELRWLYDHPSPADLPKGWERSYAELRLAASAGAEAKDLAEAADALGRVGAACGDCHANAGIVPPLPEPPTPADEPGVQRHMVRYRFAVDRLWEGLVLPSDARWALGATVFDDPAVPTADLSGVDQELAHEAKALAERVNTLGREAGGAMGQTARGVSYGEVLTACAECHALLR